MRINKKFVIITLLVLFVVYILSVIIFNSIGAGPGELVAYALYKTGLLKVSTGPVGVSP